MVVAAVIGGPAVVIGVGIGVGVGITLGNADAVLLDVSFASLLGVGVGPAPDGRGDEERNDDGLNAHETSEAGASTGHWCCSSLGSKRTRGVGRAGGVG